MLDSVFFDGVKIAGDKLDDVGEPVLSDGSDHVNTDFVLNILAVSVVGHTAGVDTTGVSVLGVDHSIVLFSFISGLEIAFTYDVQLGASLRHVLVADDASVDVDVETLTAGGEVGTNLVRNRQVVALGADWGGQGAAERVYDWREATHSLVRSAEAEGHQLFRVVGQETELLLTSHGIVASAKKFTCDACLVKGFGELAGGGVADVVSLVWNMTPG